MNAPASRILIVGNGGHGRVVADAARAAGVDAIGPFEACTAAALEKLAAEHGCDRVHVAIGFNPAREEISRKAEEVGLRLAAIVHPAAIVACGVAIGDGSVVMAGAVVQANATIGRGVIVNTRAGIDHDCVVDDFSAISPGAVLGGNVRVGARSWVGLGAAVIHGRTIGADTVIGAGAVVVRDVPALVVAWGNPCREIRRRNALDQYL